MPFARPCLCAVTAVLIAFSLQASVIAQTTGFDPRNLDRKVSPADDFYRYAAGGWIATHKIPPDRTSWGAFDEVLERNEQRLRTILESSEIADAPVGNERRKLGDFYAACTDTDGIEYAGIRGASPAVASGRRADGGSATRPRDCGKRRHERSSGLPIRLGARPEKRDARDRGSRSRRPLATDPRLLYVAGASLENDTSGIFALRDANVRVARRPATSRHGGGELRSSRSKRV